MLVMMAGGAPTCPYAPVAKFLVPEWGDIVDSGIGLLHRPDRLHTQAVGPVRQPIQESTSLIFHVHARTLNFSTSIIFFIIYKLHRSVFHYFWLRDSEKEKKKSALGPGE
jgi:hypothetical protein